MGIESPLGKYSTTMSSSAIKTSRYQALDLWRGLICLFVVLEHAVVALWSDSQESWVRRILVAPFQTNLGTPLFFVISGYCIAASLVGCQRRNTAPLFFLARRFWRVFPPYWAALIGFAALVAILDYAGLPQIHRNPYTLELPSLTELTSYQWAGNITLTETWRSHVTGGEANIFTRIAWSLCYQEQFYVVCFLVLLLCRKHLFKTLGILTAILVGLRIVASDAGALWRLEGTFPVLWHQFAVGLGAYYVLNCQPSAFKRRGILVILALVAIYAAFSQDAATSVSALFGLLMIGLHRWDAAWAKIRALEPLRALGKRSYSIYLAHLPVMILVAGGLAELGVTGFWGRTALTVPLSTITGVVAGLVFYRVIESRFLEFPSYTRPKSLAIPRPAAAGRLGQAAPSTATV